MKPKSTSSFQATTIEAAIKMAVEPGESPRCKALRRELNRIDRSIEQLQIDARTLQLESEAYQRDAEQAFENASFGVASATIAAFATFRAALAGFAVGGPIGAVAAGSVVGLTAVIPLIQSSRALDKVPELSRRQNQINSRIDNFNATKDRLITKREQTFSQLLNESCFSRLRS